MSPENNNPVFHGGKIITELSVQWRRLVINQSVQVFKMSTSFLAVPLLLLSSAKLLRSYARHMTIFPFWRLQSWNIIHAFKTVALYLISIFQKWIFKWSLACKVFIGIDSHGQKKEEAGLGRGRVELQCWSSKTSAHPMGSPGMYKTHYNYPPEIPKG